MIACMKKDNVQDLRMCQVSIKLRDGRSVKSVV
jgi:hypothetical protein